MDMARGVIGEITEVELSLLSKRDAEGDTDEKRVVCVAQLIAMASFATRWVVELWLNWKPA